MLSFVSGKAYMRREFLLHSVRDFYNLGIGIEGIIVCEREEKNVSLD